MGNRLVPTWLEPRVTDLGLESFVVARARMGGFARAKATPQRQLSNIGRKGGTAGSFSRWGWGQLGLVTNPGLPYLGYVVLKTFASHPAGLLRARLVGDLTGGKVTKGCAYQICRVLKKRGHIEPLSMVVHGAEVPYRITAGGQRKLERVQSISLREIGCVP